LTRLKVEREIDVWKVEKKKRTLNWSGRGLKQACRQISLNTSVGKNVGQGGSSAEGYDPVTVMGCFQPLAILQWYISEQVCLLERLRAEGMINVSSCERTTRDNDQKK